MIGQINLDTEAGEMIKNISARDDVSTITEIGTWNGMGSTKCVLEGIKSSHKTFFTIECCADEYKLAIQSDPNLPNVHYILGKIVEENELDVDNLSPQEQGWLQEDIKAMSEVPNVINKLPQKIDFLILDGGEFSTRAEFLKLKDRSKIIFLDDTSYRKNRINVQNLISDESYKPLINSSDRNGWAVFEKNHE
jgi:hypothetical protein